MSRSLGQGFLLVVLLAVSLAWGRDRADWLGQLGSPDESARRQAYEALVRQGPGILESLFECMNPAERTKNLWVQHTATTIVHNAAQSGSEEDKTKAEAALLHVLKSSSPQQTKDFGIQLLSRIGTRDSVAVLADLLSRPPYREAARCALERNPSKQATTALTRAWKETEESTWKVALLNALGARRDAPGKGPVLKAFGDADPDVRLAAIAAAGRLPGRQTVSALWKVWEKGCETEECAATDALLVAAEELLLSGDKKSARKIYHRFFVSAKNPEWQAAGLAGLAQIDGEKALPDLIDALYSGHFMLRTAAQNQLATMPGVEITGRIVETLADPERAKQVEPIRVLGLRRDAAAIESVPILMRIVSGNDTELRDASAFALAMIHGTETTDAIVSGIKNAHPEIQVTFLQILGKRRDERALPALLSSARSSVVELRVAALEALSQFQDTGETLAVLKDALQSPDAQVRDVAVWSVARSIGPVPNDRLSAELCLMAAKATTDAELLQRLGERLLAMGATEELKQFAKSRGCIVHWWVTEAIPGRDNLQQTDLLPTSAPVDVTKPIRVDGKAYQWRSVHAAHPLGCLDLRATIADRDDAGVYLYTEVESDRECEGYLSIGSDDDIVCWLNGEKVHESMVPRGWQADQERARVRFKTGTNRILAKVLQLNQGWAVSVRITDLDGNPLPLAEK
ncbi:MAG: HEAT repeat domain-containing protein [bacterium]